MKYTDDWGTVHVCEVDRPDIISNFFEHSNMIDKHNQLRQLDLALEKHWQTQNPFFRLHTTILGMNVVDCYKLADHHKIINNRIPDNEYKMTIIQFAGYLAHQLIANADYLVSLYSPTSQELRSIFSDSVNVPNSISVETTESTSTLSFGDNVFLSLRVLKDANRDEHHQITFDKTTSSKGRKQTKTRPCVQCLKEESKR